MAMPLYRFLVRASDHTHDDPLGTVLPGHGSAREHAHRIIRELKDGGYDPPGATLVVTDESGETIHSIPF
jgi:hypothetical protein